VCELPSAETEGAIDGDGTGAIDELRARGRAALRDDPELALRLDALPTELAADDPWTILYTSGTTGVPRGIVLSHGAAIYQGGALARAGRLGPGDEQLLLLPVAQVFGRMTLQAGIAVGMPTALGSARTLDRDLVEIAPACFSAVPELLERIASRWRDELDSGGWARSAVQRALDVGRRASVHHQRKTQLPLALAMQHRVAEKLVLSRMRARLGNRLRFVACGGAALRRELADFFHAFGVLVLEGYGLTEAGGVVTWNRPDEFRFGTVGTPLPGCDVRIADDGELLVRSPSVGRALARDDEQPTVDAAGFLHTGDVVEAHAGAPGPDARGWIRLVGRKRDIIKTTSGKLVAPQKIEQRLRAHEGIAHAVVLGEGRSSLVVLVDIDDEAMMEVARREGLGCRSRTDLVEHPRIRALVAEAVAAVNASGARHEFLADFALLAEPLRASAGELTAAGVPRRQVIAARHTAASSGTRAGA
jgi:long-chain acyl-CoA synthetase